MKILITGGTGLLGKAVIENRKSGYPIIATYTGSYEMIDSDCVSYSKLDIRDEKGHNAIFEKFRPEVVIHAVSVGSPDYAERNKETSSSIDLSGTTNIISLCKKFNARLIYISSNAIYDGERAPYAESDSGEPINYYGQLKLRAEEIVRKSKVRFAIIRPILMYGWNNPLERENIVVSALKKLRKGQTVSFYEDVFCNPLLAQFCAEAIWRIIQHNIYDVFNIAGRDTVSIYQFVSMAAEVFGFDPGLVKPVQQGFFKDLARRPKDTSYKTVKMENILKMKPLSIEEGLKIMKASEKQRLCLTS